LNPDLQALRDIHDALGNPWWPPAIGWWLLLLSACVIGVMIWRYRRRWPLLPPIPMIHVGDWRWDARRELNQLRRSPQRSRVKAQAAELSELLKRIAMARHGRASCAGLSGDAWLDWLSERDPEGFDWRHDGRLLLRAAYGPENRHEADTQADQQQLQRLFVATDRWISVRPPSSRGRKRSDRRLLTWTRRRDTRPEAPR
jgi:hypothetical protein